MPKKSASHLVFRRFQKLIQKKREKSSRPQLIAFIHELVSKSPDPEIVDLLRQELRHEYLACENFEAATKIALEDIEHRPQAPMPLLTLAAQLHFYESKADEAILVATRAVELADAAKEFRRHARGVLLRAASDVRDVELVKKCLQEIIELDLGQSEIDVGKEADLLARAQQVAIENELLDRYLAFLNRP